MNPPVVGVGAVVLHDGAVLLIQRANPPQQARWAFPGGRVEAHEQLFEAVVRELREETGLEGVVKRFVGWAERIGDDPAPYHFVILNFLVDVLDPDALVVGDDALDARWFDLTSIAEADLAPGVYEFLVEHAIIPDARTFSI